MGDRPSWSDAPLWAQWQAQGQDGWWWWFEVKPIGEYGHWSTPDGTRRERIYCERPKTRAWQATLQQRPHADMVLAFACVVSALSHYDEKTGDTTLTLTAAGNVTLDVGAEYYARLAPVEDEPDPCPFCGGAWHVCDNQPHYFRAVCAGCGHASRVYPTRKALVEALNRRAVL